MRHEQVSLNQTHRVFNANLGAGAHMSITSAVKGALGMGSPRVRYAVVGLGHIVQNAVLPAFHNASDNSQLVAIVSGDATKREEVGGEYDIDRAARYAYDQFDECLARDDIDAVFIGLPNNLHCEYSVRAAQAGKHVLCEKPMAMTEAECQQMIGAAQAANVRLMIAYRLHFEEANLKAIETIRSGQLGEIRLFNSVFSMRVREENIRTRPEMGGGTMFDIGIYCINAARYLFQDEPTEVMAWSANNGDPKFAGIDEMTAVVLRFPGDRLATFVSSFSGADVDEYRVVGTRGDLLVEPCYGYQGALTHYLTIDGKTETTTFERRDQFGAEIAYFSQCVLEHRDPEPSGEEGLIDVRIIKAIEESAEDGRPVAVPRTERAVRPSMAQQIHMRPVSAPELVRVESPSA